MFMFYLKVYILQQLFYVIFSELYDYYPDVCLELLELVPYYGYWKDLIQNGPVTQPLVLNLVQVKLITVQV